MWLITVLSWFNRRGQFMQGQVGLDSFFSLNKWNHHLKTAFCIYLHYLCVILQFVWWPASFKCDKYAKNKKQEGGKNLFTALYIYTFFFHLLKEKSCPNLPGPTWKMYCPHLLNNERTMINSYIYNILPKVLGRPLLMNRFDYFSNFYEYKS